PALTAEGKHELSSTSVDQAGNESAHSDAFVIYLDVTPPDLSGAKLLIDDVTADNIVNAVEAQGSISLTGTLTGLPSDAKGVKISISLNGSTYDAIVNGTAWSVNVPGIQLVNDSDHQFEVKVIVSDEAGNAAQLDGSKWYEAITTPPGASSLSNIRLVDDVGAITGDIVNGTVTDDGKPTYMGKATADVVKVQILDNNQVIGEAIVDKNGMWSFEPAQPLTRGMHSFQVRPVDRAGNVGGPTVAIDFEMAGGPPAPPVIDPDIDSIAALFSDATPKSAEQKAVVTPSMFMPIATFASLVQEPAPPLSRGMVGDTLVTNKVNPNIKGTATPGDIVKLFDQLPSGELVPLGTAIADAQGKWSITTPALTEGLHRFVATSTDSAGGPSYEFPVLIDITAPTKPSLPEAIDHTGDIQGPIANGGVTDEQSPVLHGKGEAGTKVTVYDNGSVVGTATVDHNGEWSLRPGAPLAEGAHKITVTLTDAAGNVSESSDALQFTVDTIAPETSTTIFYHDNVGANQG
ncbi:MAG: Ig-like domain-containing protein, partial [Stenotrophomonas sp.]